MRYSLGFTRPEAGLDYTLRCSPRPADLRKALLILGVSRTNCPIYAGSTIKLSFLHGMCSKHQTMPAQPGLRGGRPKRIPPLYLQE